MVEMIGNRRIGFCPQIRYLLWMQKRICTRLSTERVPGVDRRFLMGTQSCRDTGA